MTMVRDGDGGGGARLVFAYYITGHDVGQATRALELVGHLLAAGHHVHVVTAAPEFVRTTGIASPRLHMRKVEQVVLECGAPNALTVDRFPSLEKFFFCSLGTHNLIISISVIVPPPSYLRVLIMCAGGLQYYDTAVVPRESILRSEAKWLKSIEADIVVSDVGCAEDMNGSAESSPQPLADTMTPPLKSLSGLVVNGLRSPKNQIREKATACLLPDCKSPQVVHAWEKTPSPPSKRRRGRSLPPTPADSSHVGLPAARRRSSSSPPTPERKRAAGSPPTPERKRTEDETMTIPKAIHSPTTIFWDIENCSIPNDAQVEKVCENIREALWMNFAVDSVTVKAYGASNRIRKGLQRTGVTLVDIPNRRKDAADKLILVDMLLSAHDNLTGSSILLISGDGDFAPAVQALVQRGHTVGIAIPSVDTAAAALISAGSYVWDWPSLAQGGIVIPTSLPDDFDILKAQMIHLFKSNGGYIDLVRILPEYRKAFGKQIRLANYGSPKLIDLFLMMGNPFFVMERKMVFLNMQPALEECTTNQQLEDQASTCITSEVLADGLFVNTEEEEEEEEDAYGPMEDEFAERMTASSSNHEDEPNEPSIIDVFIGENVNKEPEKGFEDCIVKK